MTSATYHAQPDFMVIIRLVHARPVPLTAILVMETDPVFHATRRQIFGLFLQQHQGV